MPSAVPGLGCDKSDEALPATHDGQDDVLPFAARRQTREREELLMDLLQGRRQSEVSVSVSLGRVGRGRARGETHLAVDAHLLCPLGLYHPANLEMDKPLQPSRARHPLPANAPDPPHPRAVRPVAELHRSRDDAEQERVVRRALLRPLIESRDRVARKANLEHSRVDRLEACRPTRSP